jgi:hypothetical protein
MSKYIDIYGWGKGIRREELDVFQRMTLSQA